MIKGMKSMAKYILFSMVLVTSLVSFAFVLYVGNILWPVNLVEMELSCKILMVSEI